MIAGVTITCVLTSTGGVTCWGNFGTPPTTVVPSGAMRVSSGASGVCVVVTGGGAKCGTFSLNDVNVQGPVVDVSVGEFGLHMRRYGRWRGEMLGRQSMGRARRRDNVR